VAVAVVVVAAAIAPPRGNAEDLCLCESISRDLPKF